LLDHEKKEVGTSAADAHSALVSNHSKNIVADIGPSQYPEEWELLRQATAAQGFIEALDHANEEIRLAAARAIGRWLEDADAVTRTQASDCLANLLTDEHETVRQHAAFALGKVAKEFPKAVVQAGAVGDLTDLLTDEHETVREWAAFALGEIAMHFPKVVIRAGGHHELSQGLRDSSTNVRTQADVALNKLSTSQSSPVDCS
jgi:HEAT repeat protein